MHHVSCTRHMYRRVIHTCQVRCIVYRVSRITYRQQYGSSPSCIPYQLRVSAVIHGNALVYCVLVGCIMLGDVQPVAYRVSRIVYQPQYMELHVCIAYSGGVSAREADGSCIVYRVYCVSCIVYYADASSTKYRPPVFRIT